MNRYTYDNIAPLVVYVIDQNDGRIIAILDESHDDNPRTELEMARQASAMVAGLNKND